MKIRFIGDLHGNMQSYAAILGMPGEYDESVQVGDFGVGFGHLTADFVDGMIDDFERITGKRHRFIRGNHDDPDECRRCRHYIPDGTVEYRPLGLVFYLGGASSIDRQYRTEGVDWWPGEELTVGELTEVAGRYQVASPRVVVTHECPESFARDVMIPAVNGRTNFPSRTRDALDVMASMHHPSLHLFGHWHHDLVQADDDVHTTFMCLGIGSYIDLEV